MATIIFSYVEVVQDPVPGHANRCEARIKLHEPHRLVYSLRQKNDGVFLRQPLPNKAAGSSFVRSAVVKQSIGFKQRDDPFEVLEHGTANSCFHKWSLEWAIATSSR